MRIVHVDNIMIRRYGNCKVNTGRKFLNGMIRNNWKVLEFSDRDIAKFEAPLNIKPLGFRAANRRLIQTCDNFRPDIVLIGHCDIITNHTLLEIRKILPEVKMIYRNIDPFWRPGNKEKIKERASVCDGVFATTGGEELKEFCTGKNVSGFIPNATDPCIEDLDNSQKTEFERDLMYAGKGAKTDARYPLIVNLHERLGGRMRVETYGIYGNPPVWSHAYDHVVATSKMSLNLNRFEGWPLYSSDRISHLMGNGLLTFIWDKGDMRRFFTDEHVGFFKDEDELVKKAVEFQNDDGKRKTVAAAGRAFYHEHFSGQRIVSFMVEATLGLPFSHDYIWQDEVYR